MKAGIIQFAIKPGDTGYNLGKVKEGLNGLARYGDVRLAVLPEMWGTGFPLEVIRDLADKTPELIRALEDLSRTHETAIVGSLPEVRNGNLYNTAFFIGTGGSPVGRYNKIHPFPPTGESLHFASGYELPVFETDMGKAGVIICYDLRFPELCRSLSSKGALLIIVCAQWPAVRAAHWETLTSARAVENQCFLLAANCCGTDGRISFAGNSRIIGPDGSIISGAGEAECTIAAEIDVSQVHKVRSLFNTIPAPPVRSSYRSRIKPRQELKEQILQVKREGKRVVFTNGCFDILHVGHVRYLEKAKERGNFLVVAVNSDDSVRKIKGPSRPINDEISRAELVAALTPVDAVVVFPEETPYALIDLLRPDVLVKGGDWAEKDIVGADIVRASGGEVATISFVDGFSTTRLIEKLMGGREQA
ncbi:MAG: D-glycero-beta-D-manno-heptose 1-phosphate adenylyltransferase [Pseudomonadota bacterium]